MATPVDPQGKAFRLFALGFAFVAACLALAMHVGLDLWSCAKCSLVNDQPFSAGLAWGGPPVLLLVVAAVWREIKAAPSLLVMAALLSVALVTLMFTGRSVCPVCMFVHIGVLSAALSLVPRGVWLGFAVLGCAVIFGGTGGWDKLTAQHGVATFRPRPGEQVPADRVFVLFGDPECPRCQIAEANLAQQTDITVLHRWVPLAHSRYRSIRVAAVVETAKLRDPALGERLRQAILAEPEPYTDATILRVATSLGVEANVRAWLDKPDERALVALEDDKATADELGVTALPAVAALSAPRPDGTRTLKLLPSTLTR